MKMAWETLASRVRRNGLMATVSHAGHRVSQRLAGRMNWAQLDFPLRDEDVADSLMVQNLDPAEVPGRPLEIGWLAMPPSAGSGGHTTFFRMLEELELRGHRCTLFLYDKFDDDVARHIAVVRENWPELKAQIRSATDGFGGMDAMIASSWATAHVLVSRASDPLHKFYFIQDYEPYFHPMGTQYELAADSYRFGLHNVALGGAVTKTLDRELGILPEAEITFGCDTETYRILERSGTRSGIAFYAKLNSDRRGVLLAKLALEKFHRSHPEQEIHVYGDVVTGWNFPVTNHGNLTPRELNELYNSCIAGLALSFTNISLVPVEMMASGCVPVLNDSSMSRGFFDGDLAVWAPPTPAGLAQGLDVACARFLESNQRRTPVTDAGAEAKIWDWSRGRGEFADFVEGVCFSVSSGTSLPLNTKEAFGSRGRD